MVCYIGEYQMELRIWDKEKDNVLKSFYYKKGGIFCSKIVGLTDRQVINRAGKLGLKLSKERKRVKQSINSKIGWETHKFNVDENNFIINFTPQSAYVLGILWADGNLNNKSQRHAICLEIVAKDAKNIKKTFMSTGKWGIYGRIRSGRQSLTKICTNNFKLYNFLEDNDYEIKTGASANKILNKIPTELHQYWWRGFFDGDGCFYVNKKNRCFQLSLAGSFSQNWDFAEELLNKLEIKTFGIKRREQKLKNGGIGHSSIVIITNREDIVKFGNFIYGIDDKIGFKRKKKKFSEIKKYTKVRQIFKDGKCIIYESMNEASKQNNINLTNIHKACRYKIMIDGCVWRYDN